jgi:hypothetical protein
MFSFRFDGCGAPVSAVEDGVSAFNLRLDVRDEVRLVLDMCPPAGILGPCMLGGTSTCSITTFPLYLMVSTMNFDHETALTAPNSELESTSEQPADQRYVLHSHDHPEQDALIPAGYQIHHP